MTGKLHELIATEPSVTARFNAMREETLKVFGRPEAFIKSVTTKKHFDEESAKLDVTETKDLTTTVSERLKYLLTETFSQFVDVQLNKDATNQTANADLVVNGVVLAAGLPATTLLDLEKELASIRNVIIHAPTLSAGPVWIKDENEGLYVTKDPKVTFSTKKTMKPVVLVPATDRHPAQVEKIMEDVPVAKIEQTVWSGMLTSVEKAEILERVDSLIIAAKRARMRANSTEATDRKIGRVVADYVLTGATPGQ